MVVRALMLTLFMMLAVITGGLESFTAQAVSPTVERGEKTKKITESDKAKVALNKQQRLEDAKIQLWLVMAEAAVGDQAAEDLVDKFKASTLPAGVQPNGELLAHFANASEGQKAQLLTPLVIVGPGELDYLASQEPVRGFVFRDGMFVYAATDLWTPWFLGVVALGQTARWDSLDSGQVTDLQPLSPSWLDMELRAQQVMTAAVDRHTGGAFLRVIDEQTQLLGRELPTQLVNLPRLTEDELNTLTALAFSGEIILNPEESARRSRLVATAYYLALVEDTPDAHQSVLRLMRSWDKEG
jgi:hypothetical protein